MHLRVHHLISSLFNLLYFHFKPQRLLSIFHKDVCRLIQQVESTCQALSSDRDAALSLEGLAWMNTDSMPKKKKEILTPATRVKLKDMMLNELSQT